MTHEQVIKKLRNFIYFEHGTLTRYAKNLGVSCQFVSMVLNGAKEPSNYMLHDIGIVKTTVTVYSKMK